MSAREEKDQLRKIIFLCIFNPDIEYDGVGNVNMCLHSTVLVIIYGQICKNILAVTGYSGPIASPGG